MRTQEIEKAEAQPNTVVIDNRTKKAEELAPNARVVHYVEMKDMDPKQVILLMQEIADTFSGSKDQHFVVPIRHGKIGSDIEFEHEFLATVNKLCEIKDGTIALRDGARDIIVTRDKV
jgi:hypothetical protein